jgi:NAD(P)-dependent dehydrogenase (short-subunit alcohol dehydrogenase family)
MQLSGKVAVVTGGAQGIGRALAERFRREGARVVVSDRNAEGAAEVARAVDGLAIACDVSDAQAVRALVDRVEAEVGSVALYASNAGILERDPDFNDAASPSPESWARSWSVNVMGHVHAAQALLPHWRERREGYFLATVSAAGLLSQVGSATYSTTKHAALGYCEYLAITHKDDGIKVSALCPQGVDTAMARGADANAPALLDGLISPEAVADSVIAGLTEERFLILPHPQVAQYMKNKVDNYDRWLGGMAKLRRATGW